jgi:putative two-component system response regulator
MSEEKKQTVLVVDDDPFILSNISELLERYGYSVTTCENALEALDRFRQNSVDAVVTDVRMPFVSGIELLEKMSAHSPDVPVILMTAFAEFDTAVEAIKKGAYDFILKPYRALHLLHSVEKAVDYKRLIQLEKEYKKSLEEKVRQRTQELLNALTMVKDLSNEVVQRLTAVAEHKDSETGAHIIRISRYAGRVAEALNLPADLIEAISFASPMHDIGKVGIPDRILLKPDKLSPEEFEIIKTHTVIGETILLNSSNPLLQMAASIALNHHEKWDGSGYPRGLRGQDIPIEGRVVMICDQYDALVSKRPYKPSLSHRKAVKIITEGDEKTLPGHFDPDVLRAFTRVAPELEKIYLAHLDRDPPP